MQSGYYFIAIVAILVSVVSASYYLKIIKVLHTSTEGSEGSEEVEITKNTLTSEIKTQNILSIKNVNLLTNFHSFLISSLTLSILLFILKPSIILNITQVLSLSLFNF